MTRRGLLSGACSLLVLSLEGAAASEQECSQAWCASTDNYGGRDCWAGSTSEPCSCTRGTFRMLEDEACYYGETLYLYTCCEGLNASSSAC